MLPEEAFVCLGSAEWGVTHSECMHLWKLQAAGSE